MAYSTSQPKSSATRAVFDIVELREAILALLDLEQLYSARRVCKTWRACIENSVKLKRCMFKLPIASKPDLVRWSGDTGPVTTVPIVLNPILKRIIYVPMSALEVGSTEQDAYLKPRNLMQRIENALPLYENILDIKTPTRCNFFLCGCNTIDMDGRDIMAIGEAEPFPRSPAPPAADWQEDCQSSWKHMYISQPPVKDIMVRNPFNSELMSDTNEFGYTLGDLLELLEGLFLLADVDGISGLDAGRLDIELLLPLQNADGTEPAKVHNGSATWWRALKNRVKLEVVQDLGPYSPYMEPLHFPFMPNSSGETISLIT